MTQPNPVPSWTEARDALATQLMQEMPYLSWDEATETIDESPDEIAAEIARYYTSPAERIHDMLLETFFKALDKEQTSSKD